MPQLKSFGSTIAQSTTNRPWKQMPHTCPDCKGHLLASCCIHTKTERSGCMHACCQPNMESNTHFLFVATPPTPQGPHIAQQARPALQQINTARWGQALDQASAKWPLTDVQHCGLSPALPFQHQQHQHHQHRPSGCMRLTGAYALEPSNSMAALPHTWHLANPWHTLESSTCEPCERPLS
jgi:hypothetical protein